MAAVTTFLIPMCRAIMFIITNFFAFFLTAVSQFLMAALAWSVLCVYSSSPEGSILIFVWPDFPETPLWGQTVVARQQGS